MVLVVVLVVLAVIVVVGVMILTQLEKRRTAALQAVAAAHGWSFSPTFSLPPAYSSARLFGRGRLRRHRNLIVSRGSHSIGPVEIFDYDYQRGQRKPTTHRFSVGATVLAGRQPHLLVDNRTEIGHPLADVASSIDGIRGIDAKVRVWCEEPAFAERVLTDDVLAALRPLDRFGIEIGDQVIVWARRLSPERQATLIDAVTLICAALDARPNGERGERNG